MQIEDSENVKDKDTIYRRYYDAMQSKYLKSLICDEVIEEYKKNPLGQHSEPLFRILHFFSSAEQKDKYVIMRESDSGSYRIVALSGERGVSPTSVSDETFNTITDAYVGVFLKRIQDLKKAT